MLLLLFIHGVSLFPVFLEFIEEGASAESQGLSGFGSVITMFFQGLKNQAPFHFSDFSAIFGRHGFFPGYHCFPEFSREMFRHDNATLGQESCPFHGILEFPDIAWPGPGGEKGDDCWR